MVLHTEAETNLRRGLMLSDGNFGAFLSNPIAASFLGLALACIIWHASSGRWSARCAARKNMVSAILRT